MKALIIAEISRSTRIKVEDQETWIDSRWLDGDTVKPRFVGLVQAKLDGRSCWEQPRNQQDHFSPRYTAQLIAV